MAAALGWIQPVLRPSRFDGERITEVTWERFFSREEPVHAHVAMHDGCLVGIAHFLFHRSTTRLTDVCYLQDLFTAEEARGRGVGRRLIESVFDVACAAGSSRVYWQTKTTMFQVARFTTRSRSTRDLLSIHTRFSRRLADVNYFFRRRQLFLPVLSLHHWSTIAQSDAKSVRSSGSEISARFRS